MKTKIALSLIAAANLALSGAVFATGAKTYEVTGTVLEVTPTKIAVQKDGDRWEIDLDPQTKVTGELKVGGKVAITYIMSATKVDATVGLIKFGTPATQVDAASTATIAPDSQKKKAPLSSPTAPPER
jgi:hypothetical protein